MTYAATDVTVTIESATLLRDVSIEIQPGEVVALAGPNGAGKSTLINVLAGDVRPGRGTATLDGRTLRDIRRAELAERRAVMGTDGAVAFGFTASEVVHMGRMPRGGSNSSASDQAMVDELLSAVDCMDLAGRVMATLSTGERQRVQLARAIAQVRGAPDATDDSGRYLLLDEPTSSLDPAHQHMAMRLLRRHADTGAGVLAVLHDLNLAAAYADRIVLMRDARVVAQGSPVEVLNAGTLGDVFDVQIVTMEHPAVDHPVVAVRTGSHEHRR